MNEEFENVVEEANENTEAQTVEQNEEGIELTDTTDVDEKETENKSTEENEEDSKPKGRFVTEEEINNIVERRVARKMSKLEREYESKYADYKDTEAVLNAGLQTSNIKEANKKMREYYKEQGINVPEPAVLPHYSEHDLKVLAEAEAKEIIEDGYDAMVNEANRLAQKGWNNMDNREKIIFSKLGDELTLENNRRELQKIGAKKDLLKDDDFINFKNKFNSNVPISEVYDLYKKNQPKPKVETPGSMKNTGTNNAVKDFYSYEEASKFTKEDYDKNPELFKAVEKSMLKW